MHDADRMRRVERRSSLAENAQAALRVLWAATGQHDVERRAAQQFHYDIGAIPVGEEVMDRHHVGMMKLRRRSGLARQLGLKLGTLRVVGTLQMNAFQRDLPV